jgi:hypothetical protein
VAQRKPQFLGGEEALDVRAAGALEGRMRQALS